MDLPARERLLALLRRYDRPVPRYTSYPPATRFHAGVGASDYRRTLEKLAADPVPASVYVHVPFCEERCAYCGCYVIPTRRHEVAGPYLAALERECALLAEALRGRVPLGTLHLGGGTPTYLAPEELERLAAAVRRTFPDGGARELSAEIDPRVTGKAHLEALRALGFRRISLGVQDTSEEVQRAIGRNQSRAQTEKAIACCRELGFEGINVDLVYGLPHQTPDRFEATLEDVIAWRPDRLAVFGYAHLPSLRPNQRRIPEAALPGPEGRLELALLAYERLTGAGYRHIGLDHYALPEDDLVRAQEEGRLGRNFMGYTPWGQYPVLGLGVSSIGGIDGAYFQNEKKLSAYSRALEAGRFPIARGWLPQGDDAIRRYAITEILSNLRLDAGEVERRFDVRFDTYFAGELAALAELERDGIVRRDGAGITVTETGRLFVRIVASVFDRYLPQAKGAVYSRSV